MIRDPGSKQFWLAAPWFVDEQFSGEIAGFELRQAKYSGAHNFSPHETSIVCLDFSIPHKDLVLDRSGKGNHGRFPTTAGAGKPAWYFSPERLPMTYTDWSAPKGMDFAINAGKGASIELLRTQGLFSLDRVFTAEMWIQDIAGSGQCVLLGDALQGDPKTSGFLHAGWSLVKGLENGNKSSRRPSALSATTTRCSCWISPIRPVI